MLCCAGIAVEHDLPSGDLLISLTAIVIGSITVIIIIIAIPLILLVVYRRVCRNFKFSESDKTLH